MNEIEIIDPCTSPVWLDFVTQHPDAGIFHHPVWLRLLNRIYGYRTFGVCLMDKGKIVSGIPFMEVRSWITGRRWISVPFSDHCKPLLSSAQHATLLLQYLAEKISKEIPRIEIRWGIESGVHVYKEANFVNHSLTLCPTPDIVFKTFKKTQVQQPILKAMREGVEVTECKTIYEFARFYDLQVDTRKRLGVPAQPGKFFRAIWDDIVVPRHGFALLASRETKVIGGAVFFSFAGRVTYKYAASDYSQRAFKANDVILWEAIKKACESGATTFDFGRSEKKNVGLRTFKNGWGTAESDLDYTILSTSPPTPSNDTKDKLVARVIRNAPKFVCRLSGEILYKHYA